MHLVVRPPRAPLPQFPGTLTQQRRHTAPKVNSGPALRRSLEAVAAKVRRHEETIRRLERARSKPE